MKQKTFFEKTIGILLALLLLACNHVQAEEYNNSPDVQAFINDLTSHHGFAKEQLTLLFKQAKKQQPILDLISKPAEKAKPWKDYQAIFLTQQRLDQGLAFWNNNEEALNKAEHEYGVPAQIIVAIIGVETFYGRNTGNWSVLDALTTLSFNYPPRSDFFKRELKQFLLLTREEQLDPLTLKGSYAGAMGIPQFMPSSFRAYAVDFDHDGHINIWTNPTDAIGSVANYFKAHGWKKGEPIVFKAIIDTKNPTKGISQGLNLDKTIGQIKKMGWSLPIDLADNTPLITFQLEGKNGNEFWAGLANFEVITRYNRSVMYSLAVYQLSEQLRMAKHEQ